MEKQLYVYEADKLVYPVMIEGTPTYDNTLLYDMIKESVNMGRIYYNEGLNCIKLGDIVISVYQDQYSNIMFYLDRKEHALSGAYEIYVEARKTGNISLLDDISIS